MKVDLSVGKSITFTFSFSFCCRLGNTYYE